MRILVAHNFYQIPGGEDSVFRAESDLLEAAGHEVRRFEMRNDAIEGMGALARVRATVWNGEAEREIGDAMREFRPDVAHFHNTFPLLSPAVYDAAHEAGVPVVQTLHNYRLLCVNALLYREGHVCERCVGKLPIDGVRFGCYRGSRAASAAVTTMLGFHRLRGTYRKRVQRYVALTEFARAKFVEGGLPADRISVKPNFVPDAGVGGGGGGYALFVGRLQAEKGVRAMVEAWRGADLPLKVVGGGPMEAELRALAGARVEFLGPQGREEVGRRMREADALVFPSEWYEGMPMTLLEAKAAGLPVAASRLGAMVDLVHEGIDGTFFAPSDGAGMVAATEGAIALGQAGRAAARKDYEARFSPGHNLDRLLAIYDEAREELG